MSPDESHSLIPDMRLGELLLELRDRLEAVLSTRDRVHALLNAVVLVGSDLDLETVLHRIVETATTLVDAAYGALGVVGEGDTLIQFIPVGLSQSEIAAIEHWPHGLGLLGLLIKRPQTLRLARISDHPESHGFPPGHPPMGSFLGVPVKVREEVFGNLYLTEKRGGAEFDEEDEAIVIALATAAGVAIANARLYEESRSRETWLQASAAVTTSLLSGRDVQQVLTEVAHRARQMAGADITAILLPAPDGDLLQVTIADGPGAQRLVGTLTPIDTSLAGGAYRSGEPSMVTDLAAGALHKVMADHLTMGPEAAVPLGAPGSVRGVLSVFKRIGRTPFSRAELLMLHAFAGQAALALELAEARTDAERLGLLEDRDRIAKDLHDVVIQRLFAVAMTLMSVRPAVDGEKATARLGHAIDELDQTIRQIRSTIFGLQTPPTDADPGLRARVTALTQEARGHLGFMPGLLMEGQLDNTVPEPVAEQLLAVLREALSNLLRHARASAAGVLVEVRDGQVTLVVTDNGIGMPRDGHRSGLRNMRERAEQRGGSFTAQSPAEGGTRLSWTVPLT
ncbi:sensor histidine kinase [Herbidospora mongoliensis]|uniref:sensor histidine kinase n=1 Tax=Herbidospora mongoliensis TaxID=688067 RepID=UPI000832AC6C|nr:GAF domain-containing protein [Herbidospora mongoliensis]